LAIDPKGVAREVLGEGSSSIGKGEFSGVLRSIASDRGLFQMRRADPGDGGPTAHAEPTPRPQCHLLRAQHGQLVAPTAARLSTVERCVLLLSPLAARWHAGAHPGDLAGTAAQQTRAAPAPERRLFGAARVSRQLPPPALGGRAHLRLARSSPRLSKDYERLMPTNESGSVRRCSQPWPIGWLEAAGFQTASKAMSGVGS
jgi:hypothetical protein